MVRQKALDVLFHTISAEGAVFFLPDGNGLFTYIVLKNLDKAYCNYYKTYFYQFDPLHLIHGLEPGSGLNPLEKTISYDSFLPTEYYNDFLKPQRIHHKLIVNLVAEKELYGRIVLTRPRKSDRFSKNEVRTVKNHFSLFGACPGAQRTSKKNKAEGKYTRLYRKTIIDRNGLAGRRPPYCLPKTPKRKRHSAN